MKILVSACLLGENVKYNGKNNKNDKLLEFLKDHEVVSVCPEVMGGLSTPRIPSEVVDGVVINKEGQIVDREFKDGAEKALETAKREKIDLAILQSRSPSCGVNARYSGQFNGSLINEPGIFAALLANNGFKVLDIEDLDTLL